MSYCLNYNLRTKIKKKNLASPDYVYSEFINYLLDISENKSVDINFIKMDSGLERYYLKFMLKGNEKELSPNKFSSNSNNKKLYQNSYIKALASSAGSCTKTGWVIYSGNCETDRFKTIVNIRTEDTYSTIKSEYNSDIVEFDSNHNLKYMIPVSKNNIIKIGDTVRDIINDKLNVTYNVENQNEK